MHRKEYTRFPAQKTCSIFGKLHEIDRRPPGQADLKWLMSDRASARSPA
jgi:hypothetical protein